MLLVLSDKIFICICLTSVQAGEDCSYLDEHLFENERGSRDGQSFWMGFGNVGTSMLYLYLNAAINFELIKVTNALLSLML